MQSLLYFLLFSAPLTVIFLLIRREQQSMQRINHTFVKLVQKFESWQMLR
ncbi:hypothetical protein GA0116948_104125 [Chitinophaga costaii]|uniref:Uncharacterized protein n=1 Tax=Chitinophaga costaii TaxID=1335309 RepID=A0A1C4CHF9_9BACT|nr:hypothetical protein [Chitinophaga costaii]SCC18502.1 hypothetical protein GA0116948_104125 [Chitinophaga costaii]